MNTYTPTQYFIIRQPRYPITKLFQLTSNFNNIISFIKSNEFNRLLTFSSQSLQEECIKYINNQLRPKDRRKMRKTLLKYISRITTRCTPFGEFASIGIGRISEYTELSNPSRLKRWVTLDSEYEHLIMNSICNAEHFDTTTPTKFQLNGTILAKGDFMFFLRKQKNGKYSFFSLHNNHIIQFLIKKHIKEYTYNQLEIILSNKFNLTKECTNHFINCLVKNGILVYADRPQAMVKESWLNRIQTNNSVSSIKELPIRLQSISKHSSYKLIQDELKRIKHIQKNDELLCKNLIQTVTYSSSNQTIATDIVGKILNSIPFFSKIASFQSNNYNLNKFINDFIRRYEYQTVPLMEVLNPEIGIGYGNSTIPSMNPIIAALDFNNSNSTNIRGKMNPFELILANILEKNTSNRIYLTDKDVENLKNHEDKLPLTMSAIFNIYSNGENDVISELHFSGPSATCLIGRFTLGNKNINNLAKEIAVFEESQIPDNSIIAEINLLPNKRSGNVNYRSNFRKYKICDYHSNNKNDIPLCNILVSIKNGEIFLIDSISKRNIIPRLSSAHNNYANTDAIYQFLGDVQSYKNINSMVFSWGMLYNYHNHFPRVYYNDIIISLEEWKMDSTQVIHKCEQEISIIDIKNWLEDNQTPRFLKIINGDKDLVVDTYNEDFLHIIKDEIHHHKVVLLRECPNIEITHLTKLRRYNNQIILPIKNERNC